MIRSAKARTIEALDSAITAQSVALDLETYPFRQPLPTSQ